MIFRSGQQAGVQPETASGPLVGNRILPGVALSLLTLFAVLYAFDPAWYRRVIALWSFTMTLHPFIDVEYTIAQVTCFNRGIDVYAVNPCDPLGRIHDYSPLWLRLSFLAIAPAWLNVVGLVQDALFALSLGFLPVPAGYWSKFLLLAALLSPTTVFGMERGNIDLLMFVMVVTGLALLERGFAFRLCGYGLFLLAGLLKFYPLVMLACLLDERPRRFWPVASAAGAIIVVFAWWYDAELLRAFANVPKPSDFGDGFGSHQLADGIAFLTRVPALGLPLWVAMLAASTVFAARLGVSHGFADAFRSLDRRENLCLFAGALLFCGCFASGPSVGYRGILLLLALPGVIAMARAAKSQAIRQWLSRTEIAMLAAMWNFMPMSLFGPKAHLGKAFGPLPFLTMWFIREALWWLIFTVLLAVIIRVVLDAVTRCPPLDQVQRSWAR